MTFEMKDAKNNLIIETIYKWSGGKSLTFFVGRGIIMGVLVKMSAL